MKIFLLAFAFLAITLLSQGSVHALSAAQRRALSSGGGYVNVDGNGGVCAAGAVGNFSGSNNHEIAYNFLTGAPLSLSPPQAAGLVGNLHWESGVNPNAEQPSTTFTDIAEVIADIADSSASRGFGIAQWTFASRQQAWVDYANENSQDPLSLNLQLQFLAEELETISSLGLAELRQAQDDRQAAWIGLSFFEIPAPVDDENLERQIEQPPDGSASWDELNKRAGTAQEILKQYGGAAAASFAFSSGCDAGTNEPSYAANPNIRVDGSPSGAHRDSNCEAGQLPGTAAMIQYIQSRWVPPARLGDSGYNCRAIINPTCSPTCPTSIHGMGRAIDIMINAEVPSELIVGDEMRNWFINNAEQYGIQRVAWNRHIWTANQDGWRDFAGTPHTDHIHMELNIEAANREDLIN